MPAKYRLEPHALPVPNAVKALRSYCISERPKKGIPLTAALELYAVAKLSPQEMGKALNSYEALMHEKKIPFESGISNVEVIYDKYIFDIKKERPSSVIHGLFYPPSRDDSALECSLVLAELLSRDAAGIKLLIVNPSPAFLVELSNRTILGTYSFAVFDNTLAKLYEYEFPFFRFVTFSELCEQSLMDVVLIMTRDNAAIPQLAALSSLSPSGVAIALMPKSTLSGHDKDALNALLDTNSVFFDSILSLPTAVSSSIPRRKCLCVFKKAASDCIYLRSAKYNSELSVLSIPDTNYVITPEQLKNSTITIDAIIKKAESSPDHVVKTRKAKIYNFSKEILLNYTVKQKNGKIDGNSYYLSLLRPGQTARSRDKSVSISKGLTGKEDEASVIEALKSIPFDSRIYGTICEDIQDFYASDMSAISIKTLWFICFDDLSKLHNYSASAMSDLMTGRNMLTDLSLNNATETQLKESLESALGRPWESVQPKYWNSLYCLFKIAKDKSYIPDNPVSSILNNLPSRSSSGISDIRANLAKKHLTQSEERELLTSSLRRILKKCGGKR